ncbi:hypothetical protein WP50_06885 [Lactiplantibacillus plantarum]|nr:hypothetical protein WP50_06880 [Lactiplantibacillus plantarum]KLD60863.1 hypothetical protein WP50_06885 [Lactiplantibacillus plantarum]
MTNAHFTKLTDYQDLESLNAYHHFVDDEQVVQPEQMLGYLAHMSRDNARTPMQWDDSQNAGFSTATPWLAVNASGTFSQNASDPIALSSRDTLHLRR